MTPIVAGRPHARRLAPVLSDRTALVAVVAATVTAGFGMAACGTAAHPPQAADPELTQLLHGMALLKLAIVAGAAWLVDWRLRQPAGVHAAAAYLAGLGLMATGPGLIWGLTHLVLGAVLFHTGAGVLAVLACKDDGLRLPLPRHAPKHRA